MGSLFLLLSLSFSLSLFLSLSRVYVHTNSLNCSDMVFCLLLLLLLLHDQFPYPHEQVGKDGLDVPQAVLDGPLTLEVLLKPGDVLYMPRGFVHEASTSPTSLSYHATIALATHDWTLAGILVTATEHTMSRVIDYRRAMPRTVGMRGTIPSDERELQEMLEEAIERLKHEVTVDQVADNLQYKYKKHNDRVRPIRQRCIAKHEEKQQQKQADPSNLPCVGLEASDQVTQETVLRAATRVEKESLLSSKKRPAGLRVREASGDAIMSILQRFKQDTAMTCKVKSLVGLIKNNNLHDSNEGGEDIDTATVCELTVLSFAKCCVQLGALAIAR